MKGETLAYIELGADAVTMAAAVDYFGDPSWVILARSESGPICHDAFLFFPAGLLARGRECAPFGGDQGGDMDGTTAGYSGEIYPGFQLKSLSLVAETDARTALAGPLGWRENSVDDFFANGHEWTGYGMYAMMP